MTESDARAIYAQFDVKVQHHPTAGRIVRFSPRNRGVPRKGQRVPTGYAVTTRAEHEAKVALVRQAVAVLDAVAPVETPAADAQLSFLAA